MSSSDIIQVVNDVQKLSQSTQTSFIKILQDDALTKTTKKIEISDYEEDRQVL